jgi:hypothetical protein
MVCELEGASWIEPDLRHTYDQVNDMMKTLTS